MLQQVFIGQPGVAFAEAEVMDGIEHVGFAHAVQAGEAIETLRKYQGLAFVVFEMGELEGREHVGAKVVFVTAILAAFEAILAAFEAILTAFEAILAAFEAILATFEAILKVFEAILAAFEAILAAFEAILAAFEAILAAFEMANVWKVFV